MSLPASATSVCAGGGGHLLFLFMPQIRNVAVFDARERQTRFLSASDDALVAAGMNHLFVLLRQRNRLQRHALPGLEREMEVEISPGTRFVAMVMGHASTEPLLLVEESGRVDVVDPRSLQMTPMQGSSTHDLSGSVQPLEISADGRTATLPNPYGLGRIATITGTTLERRKSDGQVEGTYFVPGPDGSAFFSSDGVFDPDVHRLEANGRMTIPAVEGRYYLEAVPTKSRWDPGPMRLSIRTVGSSSTRVDLGTPDGAETTGGESPVPYRRRVWLLGAEKVVVVIPPSLDRLLVLPADLSSVGKDEAGAPPRLNAIVVTSTPDGSFYPGRTWEYFIRVNGTEGEPRFELQAGPPGMLADGSGHILWAVPREITETDVPVSVLVRDKTGAATIHAFSIHNGSAKP